MARAKARGRPDDVERLLKPEVIRDLVEEVPGFDRRGLLVALIECFGGVEQFARSVYVEYQAAPAGSMAKQRWGGLICNLIDRESAVEQQRPAEQLDDAELRASILSLAARVGGGGVGVPDAGRSPA